MTNEFEAPRTSVVVYAKEITPVAEFYRRTLGLSTVEQASGFVVLEGPGVELNVVRVPEHVANAIAIAQPPQLREETPCKTSSAGLVDFHLVDGPVDALLRPRLGDADESYVRPLKFNFCPRLFPEPTSHRLAPMLAIPRKLHLISARIIIGGCPGIQFQGIDVGVLGELDLKPLPRCLIASRVVTRVQVPVHGQRCRARIVARRHVPLGTVGQCLGHRRSQFPRRPGLAPARMRHRLEGSLVRRREPGNRLEWQGRSTAFALASI